MGTTARRLLFALVGSLALGVIGLGGAALFHPDHAVLVELQSVWQVFGILAYIAIAGFWLTVFAAAFIGLYGLIRWIVTAARSR